MATSIRIQIATFILCLVFSNELSAQCGGVRPPEGGDPGSETLSAPSHTLAPVLIVHPDNPRYFMVQGDPNRRAVLLGGSHVWGNLQDYIANPGSQYNISWTGYLDLLQQLGHNFIRGWHWEDADYDPLPFSRNSKGIFEVWEIDPEYILRLRQRVQEAQSRGFYISIMLFQGWSVHDYSTRSPNPWPRHPFADGNNVSGLEVDANEDGFGREVHTAANLDTDVDTIQTSYIKQVIRGLNEFDNIIWEVANEGHRGSIQWQKDIASKIRAFETDHCQKRHPIWISPNSQWTEGEIDDLLMGVPDVVSPSKMLETPSGAEFKEDPPSTQALKPMLMDTDHVGGVIGGYDWVWKGLTRGYHPVYMDPLHRVEWCEGTCDWNPAAQEYSQSREAVGKALDLAYQMDLATSEPQGETTPLNCPGWSSTEFALLGDGEYLIYQDEEDESFYIFLEAGSYEVERFDAADPSDVSYGSIASHPGGPYTVSNVDGREVLLIRQINAPEPLQITLHPQSVGTALGGRAEFSVAAEGGLDPLRFQWWFSTDGMPNTWVEVSDDAHRFGSNSQFLVIDPVEEADEGYYYCSVWDSSMPPATEPSMSASLSLDAAPQCPQDGRTLCLMGGRFAVTVGFSHDCTGDDLCTLYESGTPGEISDTSGLFWHMSSENPEMLLKIEDRSADNGHFWFYHGSQTGNDYLITIRDLYTGESRSYHKPNDPENGFCGALDTLAFASGGSLFAPTGNPNMESRFEESRAVVASTSSSGLENTSTKQGVGPCNPSGTTLCVHGTRFEVTVDWVDHDSGSSGVGQVIEPAAQTQFGAFAFSTSGEPDLGLKILDAGPVNGSYWVFFSALSAFETTVTVRDTATGQVNTYRKLPWNYCGEGDITAFPSP